MMGHMTRPKLGYSPPRALAIVLAAAFGLGIIAGPEARASGSWAVPRFTPTWAELERDLRALGIKRRPVARPAPKPVPAPVPTGEPKPPTPNPNEGVAGNTSGPGSEGSLGTTPDDGKVPATSPGSDVPGPVCKCPEPVVPKCPEAPAASEGISSQPEKDPPGEKVPPAEKKKGTKKKGGKKGEGKKDGKKYWWQDE
jgi:hypothetical protein